MMSNSIEVYLQRLLARGAYTRYQLRKKLIRRSDDAGEVEGLLDRYEACGYVDDRTYSVLFVAAHQDWGILRLRDELRFRGVDGEIIRQALEEEQVDEEARATVLVNEWLRQGIEERRIMGRLSRRGFSYSTARRVLEFCGEEEDQDWLL